jgi:hypothetical protein
LLWLGLLGLLAGLAGAARADEDPGAVPAAEVTMDSANAVAATDDHGDSTATATVIDPDSSTAGTIDPMFDHDYFRVEVPESGVLQLYTTGSTNTDGLLLDSCRSELAKDGDSGTDGIGTEHQVEADRGAGKRRNPHGGTRPGHLVVAIGDGLEATDNAGLDGFRQRQDALAADGDGGVPSCRARVGSSGSQRNSSNDGTMGNRRPHRVQIQRGDAPEDVHTVVPGDCPDR